MLENVSIEDVYPDAKNPRRDFGDIAALADTFALNDGYPTNPIVVVRDGGIYRIVDGERRYRAMKHLRKQTCPAVVYESMEDASAAAAMVATDEKQPLTAEEKSRGVQQMLLLGIDPAKVEKAARLGKGQGVRIAKARRMVDDAGDDMSLDRMLAISEFDEGDPAVEELEACPEGEWRRVYDRIVRERKLDADIAALADAAREAGIEVVDAAPEGTCYQGYAIEPCDVADYEGVEGCVAVLTRGWRAEMRFYAPDSDEGEEAVSEERRMRDELREAVRFGEARRREYFAAEQPPTVAAMVAEKWLDSNLWHLDRFLDGLSADVDRSLGDPAVLAVAYESYALVLGELSASMWSLPGASSAERFVEWLEAFERDGYVADEADETALAICRAIVEGGAE